ncbi:hypothetical protein H0A43_07520 [Arcobacter lanthieri]|uniref:hypothetical protein n=1 Tax=Aliarcobacter lanthieri TaxID=1355374 RepID=UPI001923EBA5|nr:hypothetical protein [Aliarcobacter lanthieri]MBL3520321.1 hypothetical protein [Aliarcobacter lanthieri]
MKKILTNLFLIAFISLFNGCSQKLPSKIEYIKEEKYPFQFIELNGVYIELPKEQETCISKLKELDSLHLGIRKYYENQIKHYLGEEE